MPSKHVKIVCIFMLGLASKQSLVIVVETLYLAKISSLRIYLKFWYAAAFYVGFQTINTLKKRFNNIIEYLILFHKIQKERY